MLIEIRNGIKVQWYQMVQVSNGIKVQYIAEGIKVLPGWLNKSKFM